MIIKKFEALARDYSIKQYDKISKISKDTDIGNRTKNIGDKFSNLIYIKNFNDFNIETYEDATKVNNK